MNTKSLNLKLLQKGICGDNSFLCYLDTSKDEITSLYEECEYVFEHITDAKKSTIADMQDIYAKMFLLHNLNLVVFDENYDIVILYKIDGTIINYE